MRGRFRHFTELADAIGLSNKTITAWFAGDFDPSLSTLAALCSALGCTIDQLVDYIPDELADDPSFLPALASEPNYGAVGVVA